MFNLRHIRFITAEVQQQLEHRGKGRFIVQVSITGADGRIEELTVYFLRPIHRIQKGSGDKWKSNHARLVKSFEKNGELQVDPLAVEVVVKVSDEAIHGPVSEHDARGFDIYGPFGKVVETLDGKIAGQRLVNQSFVDFRSESVNTPASPPEIHGSNRHNLMHM